MNYLRNLDERSDDELGGLVDEVDEVEDDGTAADARDLGRIRAAVQNITTPQNGGIYDGQPWTGGPGRQEPACQYRRRVYVSGTWQ